MASIPKKLSERLVKALPKFHKILPIAKDRDINESDTVNIITDMLSEIFGYDKYHEVTTEFAIRGTYCDLALKVDDKIQYLIEAKAIGHDLKDNHLRQAIDYATNQGIKWVILTNSIIWQLHRVKFEQPICHECVAIINILEMNPKTDKDQETLYLIAKEGLQKDIREEYYEKIQNINKYIIGSFLVSEPIIAVLRKELRKFADGVKIEINELRDIAQNEIIKREIFDSEEGKKAAGKVQRYLKRSAKAKTKMDESENSKKPGASPFGPPSTEN